MKLHFGKDWLRRKLENMPDDVEEPYMIGPPYNLKETTMGATREEVYAAIDTEREYQDRVAWPDRDVPGQPNGLTVGEFVLLIDEYVAKARAEWSQEPKPEVNTLEVVRKIAGIAVNCMEQHGAPHRES